MNLRNLLMWGLIVLLSIGLFNIFQNPNKVNDQANNIAFSKLKKILKLSNISLKKIPRIEEFEISLKKDKPWI